MILCIMICVRVITDWQYVLPAGSVFLILSDVCIFLIAIGQKKYAIPVLLAIVCEGVLLLLEKMRRGSNKVEQKNIDRHN